MARGTPNRGRGRGSGRGQRGHSTPTRGGRGQFGGRGGRGGARPSQDFSGVSLDYADLNEELLGFNVSPSFISPVAAKAPAQRQPLGASTPNLYSQFPPTPPSQGDSPSQSGSTTPRHGLGAGPGARGAYNHQQQSSRGSSTAGLGRGRGAGLLNTVFGGRGSGAGGLGYHAAASPGAGQSPSIRGARGRGRGSPVVGMSGHDRNAYRPLLQPVSFVKASDLTPSLKGDDQENLPRAEHQTMSEAEEVPGDLEDKVKEGGLVEDARLEADSDEALQNAATEQPMIDQDDDEEDIVLQVEETVVQHQVSQVTVPSGFVLGLSDHAESKTQLSDSSSEEEEEEEIVFQPQQQQPQVAASFVSEQLPPPAMPAAESLISFVKETMVVESFTPDRSSQPDFESFPQASSSRAKPPPPAKLTKNQKVALKKAGKKARRAGKLHARSGNLDRLARAAANDFSDDDDADAAEMQRRAADSEDERLGREMFDKMRQVDLDDDQLLGSNDRDTDNDDEPGQPRVGDSDLEWGSNGPSEQGDTSHRSSGIPELSGMNARARRKALRKETRERQRAETRDEERMARLTANARAEVDAAMDLESKPVDKDVLGEDASDSGDSSEESGSGGDGAIDWVAAKSFADGLLGRDSGAHKSLGELDDENRAREEEEEDNQGWRTTSGSEGDSDSTVQDDDEEEEDAKLDSDDQAAQDYVLGEADAVDGVMAEEEDILYEETRFQVEYDSSVSSGEENAAIEKALLAGQTIRLQSMGQSGSGGRRDRKERKRAAKGKGKAVEVSDSSEDDDDDDDEDLEDDDMFVGDNTWADNDEDYIRGVQEIINANADLIQGRGKNRDRAARNKLFKAVQEGNFDDVDLMDAYDDDDIMLTAGPSRKAKNKSKPAFTGAFSAELEAQWDKDRSKKSEYKRQRAQARAEAAELAGGAAYSTKGKLGMRAPDSLSDSDMSTDAAMMNAKMREFLLYDMGSTTLALPPMSKKSRVAVHLLAEVYGLKSKSLGKGKARFPVLERTKRSSTFGVDERKINAIIGTTRGESMGSNGWKARGKLGGMMAQLNGDKQGGGKFFGGGSGVGGKKHHEGAVVGQGADALGEDNIGFALLKKMGWTEGMQIGVSGGLSEPVTARIKTNKGGLGSGYSVTRNEAQRMGRAASPANFW